MKFLVYMWSGVLGVIGLSAVLGPSLYAYQAPKRTALPSGTVCEVIVNGGSFAAFGAALASADEGARTCLVEPTDWLGGQMTNQGVSALDFPYQKIDGLDLSKITRQDQHIPKNLRPILKALQAHSAHCWVSKYCAEPKQVAKILAAEVAKRPTLQVFYRSVVKEVYTEDRRIKGLRILQRPRTLPGLKFSEQVALWYDPNLATIEHTLIHPNGPLVIEASELGDVLVLSGAEWQQGQDESTARADHCGQAISYPFAMEMTEYPTRTYLPDYRPAKHEFDIRGRYFSWPQIWSYRRVRGKGSLKQARPGEVSLQNWEVGNDYSGGYVFLDKKRTREQVSDWRGGLNFDTLEAAQNRSYSWLDWLIKNAPVDYAGRVRMNKDTLGTAHGLAQVPYFRGSRRAVGLDGFVLKFVDTQPKSGANRGSKFATRIATGAYPIDIHELEGCSYPESTTRVYPYYLPYEALTVQEFDNLLVAGKNLAQDFTLASSTRVHVTEFATGSASGVIAAELFNQRWSTRTGLEQIEYLQSKVKAYTPIEWNY